MLINLNYRIVGGDAHIAPQQKLPILEIFWRIRNIVRWADVGIGPYDRFLDSLAVPPTREGMSVICSSAL